ncbi:MAG TPA: CPBP family intramembrane glutamic endopeptidase, partial [Candidatus Polarisedimenticolaceae bacterium]|nr:CPBP family intramembrane glutamic endopeptidase [Candidatus Polarisedimenticolaceae bacterium]
VALLLQLAGVPVEEQAWVQELLGKPGALLRLVPWLVLVGPFAEEVFFRGYVFRFAAQRGGVGAGYAISSILFGLVHLNLSGFFVYVAIGCVLAAVYRRSESLIAPITAHTLYNSIVVLSSVLMPPPG